MTPAQLRKLDRELRAYFDSMVDGMGRAERRRAMELYLAGLLLDGERKSVEPMATPGWWRRPANGKPCASVFSSACR